MLLFDRNYLISKATEKVRWFFPYAAESYFLSVTNAFPADNYSVKIADPKGIYKTQMIELQNFNMYILELVEDHDLLIEREQYWIDTLEACKNGYNMLPFAASRQGYTPSQETIDKRVAKNKGKKRTLEQRETLSKAFKNRVFSEERNKKIGDAQRGIPQPKSQEAINKLKNKETNEFTVRKSNKFRSI